MTPARPRILLIEDSPTYAKLAMVLLSGCGYAVVHAASAAEGIRLALLELPALVFTDMRLPDGDGFQVVRRLRDDPRTRGVPVVGISADRLAGTEQVREARTAGFDAFVEKPTDERTFQRLAEEFLPASRVTG